MTYDLAVPPANPDVLMVGLGSTLGLRAAEDQLKASLERAGAHVVLTRAAPQPPVRTMMLTDLGWARAARRAALDALGDHPDPGALLYNTTTAALFWPRPGAIRFDAAARANRPGRHGLWQRPLERRRLGQAPLLVPKVAGAIEEAGNPSTPSVFVPIAVEPSDPRPQDERDVADREIAAVTYAADPRKKGLDHVLAAWEQAHVPGEELLVTGLDAPPDGREREGVRYVGALDADAFRALLCRARVYVTAPRREDYGIAQLQALADGCRVVTTPAPGPYAALPLLSAGLGWVAPPHGLRAALRSALDDDEAGYAARALEAIAPFSQAEIDRRVASELLPLLLKDG